MRVRLALFAVACAVCAPAGVLLATSTRSGQCGSHLKMLAHALQMYHDVYGTFPPAYVSDERGRQMHSWRALILPYLEEADLYKAYDFSEAWDGPNNRKLLDRMPDVFRCPSHRGADEGMTNYVAVVGRRTAWPGAQPTKQADVNDGMTETILLVEAANSDVPWTKPADLDFDAMVFQVNAPSGRGIGSTHQRHRRGGAHVVCVGGRMRFLPDSIQAEDLRGLLTIAGGEEVSIPKPGTTVRTVLVVSVLVLAASSLLIVYWRLVRPIVSQPE